MSFNILDYVNKLDHVKDNTYKCIICFGNKFKSK